MSVKITKEIHKALLMLIDELGSALEVERKTQIANSTISRYISGKLTKMNSSTWNIFHPFLSPYLKDNVAVTHPDTFMSILQELWPKLTEREKGEICGLAADFVKAKKKHIPQVI